MSAPPADPTSVLRNKNAADQAVAQLQNQVATQAKRLAAASAALDVAQQRYNDAVARQHRAQRSLGRATARERAAQASYRHSQRDLVSVAVSNYQNATDLGSLTDVSVTSLLLSQDPSALLRTASMQEQVDSYQAQVLISVHRALTAKRQAVQQRQAALKVITAETKRMQSLRATAQHALASSQAALHGLREALGRAQATQKQAETVLSQFLGGWSFADPKRAAQLNQTYSKLAKQAGQPVVHDLSHWSAAMGAAAAWRALQMIGTPYAWAGGNASGPTTGVCAGGAAANDCHVVGFDCSGLALFGWAPYLSMPHLAAEQYFAGRLHPAVPALKPGDLVFWSNNGKAAGIHHVAVYIGNGNVVQAPNSGDIVRVTPLANVDSGYFGATRPLT
jgi:cell wall-associated NlpC family hydrolase